MSDSDLLRLNAELSLQLANYWHEIDTNGGRNASPYYTEDAEFHGQYASYLGRAKIQEFYDWRVKQGPRLSVHSFTNFTIPEGTPGPVSYNKKADQRSWTAMLDFFKEILH